MSSLKDDIVSEIQRLAKAAGGQAPGQQLFAKEAGIAEHKWRGVFWARWGDALQDAGFEANEWAKKLDTDEMLVQFAELILQAGKFPTSSEVELARRSDPSVPSMKTVRAHFGGKSGLIKALREIALKQQKFGAILDFFEEQQVEETSNFTKSLNIDGWVYLLKSGDNYKIGRSDNLERRVKQISIAMPNVTNLFHAIQTDDPVGIEEYWHKRFADRRLNGEWFKLIKSDIAAFKRRKFQ